MGEVSYVCLFVSYVMYVFSSVVHLVRVMPGNEPRLSWSGLYSPPDRGVLKRVTAFTVNSHQRVSILGCPKLCPPPEEGGLPGLAEVVRSKLPFSVDIEKLLGRSTTC